MGIREGAVAHDRWDDSGLAKAMKFWPFILGTLTFVFSLGIASSTIHTIEEKISEEAATNARQEKQIAALEETTKEMVEIKRDIKELLRRVR